MSGLGCLLMGREAMAASQVVNVLMNKVELIYLDTPDAPDGTRTVYADLGRMEREPQSHRFVAQGG